MCFARARDRRTAHAQIVIPRSKHARARQPLGAEAVEARAVKTVEAEAAETVEAEEVEAMEAVVTETVEAEAAEVEATEWRWRHMQRR